MRLDWKLLSRAAAVVAPIVIGIVGAGLLRPWIPQLAVLVSGMGVWAPVVFVVAYIAVVVAMLPSFLLIILGGAVFGMVEGTVLSLLGALIGGTLAFLIARHFARDIVARRVARNPAMAAIDRTIGEDGMKLVFLLRLSSVVPFVLSNYALGVTKVRLRDFVIGTSGLLPTVLTYVAYGSASRELNADGKPAVPPLVLALAVVATVLLGIWIARVARRAVRDAESAKKPDDDAE